MKKRLFTMLLAALMLVSSSIAVMAAKKPTGTDHELADTLIQKKKGNIFLPFWNIGFVGTRCRQNCFTRLG